MKFIIFGIITFIFLIAGTLIPFVNDEWGDSGYTSEGEGVDTFTDASTLDPGETAKSSIVGRVALSILSMLLWTFGGLPLWLDLYFVILRVVWWAIIVDLVWIG